MPAAVLLPAVLAVLRAEWRFLALADHENPAGGHAKTRQVFPHGSRPSLAKREVVFGGAAFVAVPFHGNARGLPPSQPVRVPLKHAATIVAQLRSVQIEEDVAERHFPVQIVKRLPREHLFLRERLCGRGRGRWRRRGWRRRGGW